MKRRWELANILVGYTGGWMAAYLIGMGTLLRAVCGLAGALAWLGIAEVVVERRRLRNERILRTREDRRG